MMSSSFCCFVFRGTKDVKSNRHSLKRTVVIASSTEITKLTQTRPQGYSISVPFLATTWIIDFILINIRKRLPNLVNARWLWKLRQSVTGFNMKILSYLESLLLAPPCPCNMHVSEMVKKASKRLKLLRQLKRAYFEKADLLRFQLHQLYKVCLQLRDFCVSRFLTSVPNRRIGAFTKEGSLRHIPHLVLRQRSSFVTVGPRSISSGSPSAPMSVPFR